MPIKEEDYHMQITLKAKEEKFEKINELAKERGMSRNKYILEMALKGNFTLYNRRAEEAIIELCNICEEIKVEVSKDKRERIERRVATLWQYLK